MLFVLVMALAALAQSVDAERYGRVTLDRSSSKAGLGPVVFDHWLHRSMYTCRVCHVDVGFAMQTGATGISAKTNQQGFHCGACHDGRKKHNQQPIFAACAEGSPTPQCARCHSTDPANRKTRFASYTAKFPRTIYGIDWEEAEARGLVRPADVVEGVSFVKPALKSQQDLTLQSRVKWVSQISFSHRKHSAWNGCELCHPDIFPAAKQGANRYTMFHIKSGQYCGACHGRVAFQLDDCSACHKDMKAKDSLKDAVLLPGPRRASGFGAVQFRHKTHVGERDVKCEICHHPQKVILPRSEQEQDCSECHTRDPKPPVKTALQAAFHSQGATSGLCIDCHKRANEENGNSDVEFVRMLMPRHQATIDIAQAQLVYGKDPAMRQLAQEIVQDQRGELEQMQRWLKEHNAESWAPVKCHDCHKKDIKPQ